MGTCGCADVFPRAPKAHQVYHCVQVCGKRPHSFHFTEEQVQQTCCFHGSLGKRKGRLDLCFFWLHPQVQLPLISSPFLWEVIGSPYFQDLHLHSQRSLLHPVLGPEHVRQTPVNRQVRFISIEDFEVLNLWQAQVCSMCKSGLYSEQWGVVLHLPKAPNSLPAALLLPPGLQYSNAALTESCLTLFLSQSPASSPSILEALLVKDIYVGPSTVVSGKLPVSSRASDQLLVSVDSKSLTSLLCCILRSPHGIWSYHITIACLCLTRLCCGVTIPQSQAG